MEIEKEDVEWLVTTVLALIQIRITAKKKGEKKTKKPPRRKRRKH
ncbi:hypothetical protein [Selenomonas sp. F0473]|nr:hypothetical protein [Selenomonas sp. F0473]